MAINTLYKYPAVSSVLASFIFFASLEWLLRRPIVFEWVIFIVLNAVLFYFFYKNDRAVIVPVLFIGSIWAGMPLWASFGGAMVRHALIFVFTILYFFIHFDFRIFHQNDISRKDAFYLLNIIVLFLWANALLVLSDLAVIPGIVIIFSASVGCGLLVRNLFYLRREKTLLALVFALLSGELFWLISFWPFFYLTSAGVFVILIYTLWKIGMEYLEDRLRAFSLFRTLGFSLFLITVLLVMTPWFPL